MSPSVYRPLIWLGPLSVLAGAVFLQITNIGGVAGAIQSAAFAEIETLLPQLRMGLLQRPVFAQHVEILFLGLAGLCIVIVLARTTIMWAGTATLLVIATGIVFSWWMAADAGLFFDVSYATLALAAVFAVGCVFYILVGVSARMHIRRSLAQHLSPVALAAIARRPELLKLAGESRNMTYLVCAIRGFPELTDAFADDAKGLSQLTRRVMTPLVQTILDRGGAIDRLTPGGLSAFFNAPLDDPEHAVHACEGALRMTEEMEKINLALERELQTLQGRLATAGGDDLLASAKEIGGVKVLAARLDGADSKALRDAADKLKARLGSAVVVLGAVDDGKVWLVASVTKDLTGALKAGELIGPVAERVGGGGGGRADFAQAGGTEPDQLDAALALVCDQVAAILAADT